MSSCSNAEALEDRRLWIGNLDPRTTEYHLLKLVQKYGTIEKFDFIYHRTGPQAGVPRGYAFVTYVKRDDALEAKLKLNNLQVGQKRIHITWAHVMPDVDNNKPQEPHLIPALAMSKAETKTDRESQIQAIEAKLKLMEKKCSDELKINDSVAFKPPVITQFQKKEVKTKSADSRRTKPYKVLTGKRR